MMPNYRERFSRYIYATNVDGSNKASSYVRALDLLSEMLKEAPLSFDDCKNIWGVASVGRLHELYLRVREETRKKDKSVWNIPGIPKSYLQNGYCSAALKNYQEFMVEYDYENSVFSAFEEYNGPEGGIAERLDRGVNYPDYLIDGLDEKQGKDIIQLVRVRTNQNIFRRIIFKIYNQSCCITGLNIPEINRASHIIPWAEDKNKRLDPRNGLCLSATYDAAFDRNLISLDDDYRIILSKDIKEHYTGESVKRYFLNKEGEKIKVPALYRPHKDYLAKHRDKGCF